MSEVRTDNKPIRLKTTISKIQSGFWGDDPDGENDVICLRVADFNRDNFMINDMKLTLRSVSPKDKLPRILKKGDLLIEKSGGGDNQPVGTVAYFNKEYEAISSNFLSLLRPKPIHDGRFLCYLFATLYASRINIKSIKQTTGIQNIDLESYLDEKALIPPLPIQKAIAAYLDKETTRIDALIAKKERQIELLQENRQAIITRAVTKGLDPNAKMKDSGVEWIGEIPEGWEVLPLRRVLKKVIDYRGRTPEKTDEGVQLVTSRNIKNGKIDYEVSKEFVSYQEYKRIMERGQPEMGDVLFTSEAPLGEVAQIDKIEVALAQRIILFRTNERMDNRYLCLYLSSYLAKGEITSKGSGSTAEGIRSDRLYSVNVIVPDRITQSEILNHCMDLMSNIDRTIKPIEKSISLLREYRSSLITAAVSGQIDVSQEIPE